MSQCMIESDQLHHYMEAVSKKQIKDYSDIPKEIRENPAFISFERNKRIRRRDIRGFDIIEKVFFVEEKLFYTPLGEETQFFCEKRTFEDFALYYEYLDGHIYEKACYYQYSFTKEQIARWKIDLRKINTTCLTTLRLSQQSVAWNDEQNERYDSGEAQKKEIERWIEAFNACATFQELEAVSDHWRNENAPGDLTFYLWNYIACHKDKCVEVVVEYVLNHVTWLQNSLGLVFDPESVADALDLLKPNYKHKKKRINEIYARLDLIRQGTLKKSTRAFFDEETHYFCVKEPYRLLGAAHSGIIDAVCKYFSSIDEVLTYLDYDISGCDFSNARDAMFDLDSVRFDETTRIHLRNAKNVSTMIKKYVSKPEKCFDEDEMRGVFRVDVEWREKHGISIAKKRYSFDYFFDFVAFLSGDLSNADLLPCKGLENLIDLSGLNFEGIKASSRICRKLKVSYNPQVYYDDSVLQGVEITLCENQLPARETVVFEDELCIHYITDLHLEYRLKHAECISDCDCELELERIATNLASGVKRYSPASFLWGMQREWILIGGDTASNPQLLCAFFYHLRQQTDSNILLCLGNHELWPYEGKTIEEITNEYQGMLEVSNIILLQNELLIVESESKMQRVHLEEILTIEAEELKKKTRTARLLFFGGIGFSGMDEVYNAHRGIYRNVVNREQEIHESKLLDSAYQRLREILPDKPVVVFTHMPMKSWSSDCSRQKGYIYVNGHDHRNDFFDDGEIRVYADNQIGYQKSNPCLKWFSISGEYDWFSEYKDGIYSISADDYRKFHIGKNLRMTFNRSINVLYMLKKNGYYCFIHQNTKGELAILNGGSMKRLLVKDPGYYFRYMDQMIAYIEAPFVKYHEKQQKISRAIRALGGSGHIHGAIIDIDFYSHIYLNPNGLKKTAYFALDIFMKYVYPSVSSLLEARHPEMFEVYTHLLDKDKSSISSIVPRGRKGIVSRPTEYLETDIYYVSREIKKMQKLQSRILSVWYDTATLNDRLIED